MEHKWKLRNYTTEEIFSAAILKWSMIIHFNMFSQAHKFAIRQIFSLQSEELSQIQVLDFRFSTEHNKNWMQVNFIHLPNLTVENLSATSLQWEIIMRF